MSRKTNPFRLGLFILIGTVLLLSSLAILGAGKIFRQPIYMETYLNESVNGLEVGSPIKFRGVKIGSVSEIGFVTDNYVSYDKSSLRYVYVRGDLDHSMFDTQEERDVFKGIQNEVAHGLRARAVSLGLTGQLFLEIDYVDPDKNPPLKIDWEPKYIYIPSAPSMLSRVESAVESVGDTLTDLNNAKIAEAIEDVRKVARSLSHFLNNSDTGGISKNLTGSLHQAEILLTRMNKLLAAPEAETILPDASAALHNLRYVLDNSSKDMVVAVKDLKATARSMKNVSGRVEDFMKTPKGQSTMNNLSETMSNVSEASEKIKAAAVRFESTISRINLVMAGQEGNIEAILENIRRLVENLRELSGEARQYPSGVLFGNPPKKSNSN
jgi:paraquat-inducible protein B